MLLTMVPTYSAAVLRDKPLAYWRFEETGGSVAGDISGNGNTGTYVKGPTLRVPGGLTDGTLGLTLNGVDQYVSTSYTQREVTAYTIEVWLKTTAFGGTMGAQAPTPPAPPWTRYAA